MTRNKSAPVQLAALFAAIVAVGAEAATVTVNTTTDEWSNGGNCSLREAVNAVNNAADSRGCSASGTYGVEDTVVVPSGNYALTRSNNDDSGGDIDVRVSMSIVGAGGGAGGTVVDASAVNDSVFQVQGGKVYLTQLTITGGSATSSYRGAGVQNDSGLTISHSTISANNGTQSAAGGVGNAGDLTIQYSTVSNNSNASSVVGAGVDNNDGRITIVNSTVSNNRGNGPGVFTYASTAGGGNDTTLINVTTAGNQTAGITAQNGTGNRVSNSIVDDGCTFTGGGAIIDGNYNIDAGNSCGFTAAGSLNNTSAGLGPLTDNGGGTASRAIDDTSPAFDRIPSGVNQCRNPRVIDQRAAPRAGGTPDTGYAACDIGAYEYAPGYTLAVITGIRGISDEAGQVLVEWTTVSEIGTAGFHLERLDSSANRYRRVTKALVPGLVGHLQGGTYQVVDPKARIGETAFYRLVEREMSGRIRRYGPWPVTAGAVGAVPVPWLSEPYRRTPHRMSHRPPSPMDLGAAPLEAVTLGASAKVAADTTLTPTVGKIGIVERGLYRLPTLRVAQLLAEPEQIVRELVIADKLRLHNRGKPVAWFAPEDGSALYFYAEASNSPYTDENVYWLERGPGTRMLELPGAAVRPNAGGVFIDTRRFEQDKLAATSQAVDPDTDYWYWDYLMAGHPELGRKSYRLPIEGHSAAGPYASVTLHLVGAADLVEGNDHRVEVSINGAWVGQGEWHGLDRLVLDLPIAPSLLREGENVVEIAAHALSGVEGSIFYLDAIELTHPRRYLAKDASLAHYADGKETVSVDGFPDSKIHVLDIADPTQPRRYAGLTVDQGAGWRVSFRPANPDAEHFAVSAGGVKAPSWTRPDRRADLRSRNAGAEYLVIAPRALRDGAKKLVSLRQAGGLRSRLVLLEDIYDEFNRGLASPHAVRRFLTYAHRNWSQRPRYVALVGKGTLDYRDLLGHGDNMMPPMLVSTDAGLFSADNRFADVDGDGVPEAAVGRIPVRSLAELASYVDKLAAYESGPRTPDVLFLSDDTDAGGNFRRSSRQAARALPKHWTRKKVSLASVSLETARTRMFDALDRGVGQVNYMGHGGVLQLAAEGLLSASDLGTLDNVGLTPVMAALTCVVNRFELPGYDSLGEQLVLHKGGGMVAVWSSSGLSLNKASLILNRAFVRATSRPAQRRLGDAVRIALRRHWKVSGAAQGSQTYNLIGDPALLVR